MKEIKGVLIVGKIDSASVRLNMMDSEGIIQNTIDVARDLFPAEFDHERHQFTGSYSFRLDVVDTYAKPEPKAKPKKKK